MLLSFVHFVSCSLLLFSPRSYGAGLNDGLTVALFNNTLRSSLSSELWIEEICRIVVQDIKMVSDIKYFTIKPISLAGAINGELIVS